MEQVNYAQKGQNLWFNSRKLRIVQANASIDNIEIQVREKKRAAFLYFSLSPMATYVNNNNAKGNNFEVAKWYT